VIAKVDILMALRIQLERQDSGLFPSLREYHNYFGITRERLEKANNQITIMHPGPINRGVEIASDVADSEHSVILDQVTNGVADLYDLCVKKPREILNIPVPRIKKGKLANLTVFDLSKKWKYDSEKGFSKSINSPFNGWDMTGKPILVINKNKIFKSN